MFDDIYDFIFGVVIVLVMIGVVIFVFSGDIDSYYKEENLKAYNQYKDCKVLEVAHYNGFFKEDTNKLDCNGTIYNVSTSYYNDVMANH